MANKIKFIAITIALAGILAETLAFMSFIPDTTVKLFPLIKAYLSCLNLSFFQMGLLNYRNFDNGLETNFVNLVFYSLLLVGALAYHFSKQKETRLIRFFFSIVMVSHVFFIVSSIISQVVYWEYIKYENLWWLWWIINRGLNVGWIFLSLYVIRSTKKELDITYKDLNGHELREFNYASLWQRLFHLLVDAFLCIFIFSSFSFAIETNFLEKIESILGERWLIYAFLFIFRLIYYPFFEIVLAATPAKLLTETRVTNENGNKTPARTIILRTFARFIPFEPFSFFGAGGWHDTLTNTEVLRESRTGIKGRWYFLILPLFLLIGLGIYFAREKFNDYQYHKNQVSEHQIKIKELESALDHISTSDVIEIADIDNPYSSKKIFLKVEEVTKDEITVAILENESDFDISSYQLERIYNQNKNYLSTLPIKRSDLKKAYTPDYDQYENGKLNSVNLLMDGRKFWIKTIVKFYCPTLELGNESFYNGNLEMIMYNAGWPGNIIEIKNLEGDVKWENSLPEYIPSLGNREYPNFTLKASNYTRTSFIKARIVVLDSLNRKHNFILEKSKDDKKVYRE